MSDKKFDELLRNKLNQRKFEWDEAYWESAQELIATQEEGKKRRGFWIWVFAGLLLVGTGAALYLGLSIVDSPQSIAIEGTGSSQQLTANSQQPTAHTSNHNNQRLSASKKTPQNSIPLQLKTNTPNHNNQRPSVSNQTPQNSIPLQLKTTTPNHNNQRPSASNQTPQNSIPLQLKANTLNHNNQRPSASNQTPQNSIPLQLKNHPSAESPPSITPNA